MNIPELSTAMAYSNTQNSLGTKMLGKALDNAEEMGASMIKMMDNSMELSVNPHIGSHFDQSI